MASKGCRYIASGFFNDAEKLLHQFCLEESVEFPVFAKLWRDHNFVLVFAGRDKYQIKPYTNEVFLITLGFLENPSFHYKVGVFFLLYALFRNQICEPFILIRITHSQYLVFDEMWKISVEQRHKTLHYVLEYLFKTSFDFVSSPSVYGPKTIRNPQDYDQHSFSALCLMRETKANMVAFQKSNVLQNLKEMSLKYEKMKEKVYSSTNPNVSENYDQYIGLLDNLIHDRPIVFGPRGSQKHAETNIGSRRALLKAKAYGIGAHDFQRSGPSNSESDERVEETEAAVKKRKKRVKKRGRPKLKSQDDDTEENINSLKTQKIRSKKGPLKKGSSLLQFDDKPTIKPVRVSKVLSDTDESS